LSTFYGYGIGKTSSKVLEVAEFATWDLPSGGGMVCFIPSLSLWLSCGFQASNPFLTLATTDNPSPSSSIKRACQSFQHFPSIFINKFFSSARPHGPIKHGKEANLKASFQMASAIFNG
jgi:hypothetical protein